MFSRKRREATGSANSAGVAPVTDTDISYSPVDGTPVLTPSSTARKTTESKRAHYSQNPGVCTRRDLHTPEMCGYSEEQHPWFTTEWPRAENKAFSENPPPVKGPIMRKLSNRQLDAFTVVGAGVLVIIAIKQTNKVAKLQRALVSTEASRDFYADVAVRASTMMTLPQLLGLVDASVTDMRFKHIVRDL